MPPEPGGNILDCIRSITLVGTIDAFQYEIYRNPNSDRDTEIILWLDLINDLVCHAIGLDQLTSEKCSGNVIAFAEVFLYYIEYGIAQLGALQLWQRSTSDHAGTQ